MKTHCPINLIYPANKLKNKELNSFCFCHVIEAFHENDTGLSSVPSNGFLGSGSLFSVLQPFKPLTDAPCAEACMIKANVNDLQSFFNTHLMQSISKSVHMDVRFLVFSDF